MLAISIYFYMQVMLIRYVTLVMVEKYKSIHQIVKYIDSSGNLRIEVLGHRFEAVCCDREVVFQMPDPFLDPVRRLEDSGSLG